MDYYSTLGINKNASDDEIRKAYKSKSMKHHPDRGGNEEEFKKVNEAYQTLKDPQKKQMYDRYGTSDPQQMGGGPSGWGDMNFGNGSFQFNGSPQDFEEMFGSFFGGGFRQRPRPPRNKNVQLKVVLTLKEILEGKQLICLPSSISFKVKTTFNCTFLFLGGLGLWRNPLPKNDPNISSKSCGDPLN